MLLENKTRIISYIYIIYNVVPIELNHLNLINYNNFICNFVTDYSGYIIFLFLYDLFKRLLPIELYTVYLGFQHVRPRRDIYKEKINVINNCHQPYYMLICINNYPIIIHKQMRALYVYILVLMPTPLT
jgi:hypothetical protein